MNYATIDVGTNTTLLLIAQVTPGAAPVRLEERAEITRLGRGIGAGEQLGAQGIARTLNVLRDYAAAARRHGARLVAVGTEALRRAANAADFLEPAAEILGTPIEVIDGAREAALTYQAVADAFPAALDGRLAVVDIGGGSTEIVLATGGAVTFQTSLPIGSVRLTERFLAHDPAEPAELAMLSDAVDAVVAGVPFARDGRLTLIGVAGTVTSLAAMAEAMPSYDPDRVHGYRLKCSALTDQITSLSSSTQITRERIIGLDPRRADVILAGALILDRIAAASNVTDILVSDRGIRWGLLRELAAQEVP